MGLFYIVVTKTNALTQADVGVLSILTFLSSTVTFVCSLGLPTALTKFASESIGRNQPEEAASISKRVTKTVFLISSIGCAVAALISYQLSQYLFGSQSYTYLIVLMLVYTFLFTMMTLLSSTLQALFLFGRMAFVTIVFIVLSRVVGIGLAVFQMGLGGVLIGYIVGSTAALFTATVSVRGKLPRTDHDAALAPLLRFSLPLFLSNMTLVVLNWADVVIVTIMTLNYSLTGIYYIAVNSVAVLSILWTPITTTIFPALAAKYGGDKSEEMTEILKLSSRYMMYVILPGCIGLALISPTALNFFYGQNYVAGALALSILSINVIITSFYSLLTTGLTAIGKTTQILKINATLAALSVAMLVAAVSSMQTTGAALTRLIAQLVGFTLAFYLLRKEIEVRVDKTALWKSALASSAIVPFLLFFEMIIGDRFLVTQRLVVELVVASVIYVVFLRLLKALQSQDFRLLRQALPKPLARYINLVEKVVT